jgi:SH3-like domain-containing protein
LYPLNPHRRLLSLRLAARVLPLLVLVCLVFACTVSCKRSGRGGSGEIMYVAAPEANLRDRLATIYNRVGTVKNGDRVEVLERQKRFVRVRTADKTEGWIEMRALVPQETFDAFQKLAEENRNALLQGHGVTRVELNMHISPGRETDTLYQLPEAAKVEMLRRATARRATSEELAAKRATDLARISGEPAKPAPKKRAPATQGESNQTQPRQTQPQPSESRRSQPAAPAAQSGSAATKAKVPPRQLAKGVRAGGSAEQPPPMDDWWLVRDQQGHTGWVLARMVDLDVPLEVAQYAEGQRIQGAFVLNTVEDSEKGTVAQYVMLLNENREGIPYDFNQVRVFSWNLKRHRYETAYRERNIVGHFPVLVSTEDFGKEGTMPVFTVRKENADGSFSERKYRLIGNIVRPVPAAGEEAQKPAPPPERTKKP